MPRGAPGSAWAGRAAASSSGRPPPRLPPGTKGSVDHYVRLSGVGSSQRCWPWKRASSAATGTSLCDARGHDLVRRTGRGRVGRVPVGRTDRIPRRRYRAATPSLAGRGATSRNTSSLDHDLPRDNFQEDPPSLPIARRRRTSASTSSRPSPPGTSVGSARTTPSSAWSARWTPSRLSIISTGTC